MMSKFLGENWRTNLSGLFWLGYGCADMYFQKSITELGVVAILTGFGFLNSKDGSSPLDDLKNKIIK